MLHYDLPRHAATDAYRYKELKREPNVVDNRGTVRVTHTAACCPLIEAPSQEQTLRQSAHAHPSRYVANKTLRFRACAVKARIDDAWHAVTLRNSHIAGTLVARHGLEKTGEDVFERGRRAVIYYECNAGSEAYVASYFQSARRWLGHQLGEAMHLKCAPCSHLCPPPPAVTRVRGLTVAWCCVQDAAAL